MYTRDRRAARRCPRKGPATLLTGQGQTVAGREVEKLQSIEAKCILPYKSCLFKTVHFRVEAEANIAVLADF
jgi:hypothetical protein